METFELPSFVETIRQALQLDPALFAAIQRSPRGIWPALFIVCLACLSESVGQSIGLFINQVRPRRFVLALVISTLSRISGYLLWTASVWLVATYLFDRSVSLISTASAVGLAYAPQLFAFFVLTPFLGNLFSILLSLWSMLAIIVAVRVGLGLEMGPAVLTSGLGWLLIQVWQRTLGRPVYALGRWLEKRAAGVPLEFTVSDLMQLRHHPQWLKNLPDWRHLHNQAERIVHSVHWLPRDRSHG
jgi:hypothetical protein